MSRTGGTVSTGAENYNHSCGWRNEETYKGREGG